MGEKYFVSVIVPVYNGERTVEECLKALSCQNYPRQRYEIIVVDDGSVDNTLDIAKKYSNKMMSLSRNEGLSRARVSGLGLAGGDIIIMVDSDVVVRPDTISKIAGYFDGHADVDAMTGMLSEDTPDRSFFSQYKNLYMHYIFSQLPERVAFVYGSIYAFRKEVASLYTAVIDIGEDTLFGQRLAANGKKISFLKDLEVTHLKRHNFLSFIKNDFRVPLNWAYIFMAQKGWRQIGKNRTFFAHSPLWQILSVTIAPCAAISALAAYFIYPFLFVYLVFFALWISVNNNFFRYLVSKKGRAFTTLAIFVTFADNIIMASGIFCGLLLSSIGLGKKIYG